MERIALDLRKYNTTEKLGNLIIDTASLAIEASDSDTPRVNLHHYIKISESTVISPGKDKRDVLEKFTDETEMDKKTSEAGKKIKSILIDGKIGDAFVWISPSKPYPETRIVVGVKKETKSKRFEYLKCYGISTTLSRENSLVIGQLLVSISEENNDFPVDPEDLRNLVVKLKIPDGKDAFEYLSENIKLPEKDRFESILNGTADKIKAKAIKAAVIATQPVRTNPNVIYSNPVAHGGYIENQMAYLGFKMSPKKFGCGISNNDVRTNNSYYYSNTTETSQYYSTNTLDQDGPDGKGPLEVICPACGHVNKRPMNGYVHACEGDNCPDRKAIVCGV